MALVLVRSLELSTIQRYPSGYVFAYNQRGKRLRVSLRQPARQRIPRMQKVNFGNFTRTRSESETRQKGETEAIFNGIGE